MITVGQIKALVASHAFKTLGDDDEVKLQIEENGISDIDVRLGSITVEHFTDTPPDALNLVVTVTLDDLSEDVDDWEDDEDYDDYDDEDDEDYDDDDLDDEPGEISDSHVAGENPIV